MATHRKPINNSTTTPRFDRWTVLRKWGTLAGFVVLLLAFTIMRPDVFPSWRNLSNVVEQIATLAIVSSGVTIVMVLGDFDLSVGAIASLCGVVAADLMRQDLGIASGIFIALAIGIAAGSINGLLVAYGGLSAFVATLATMTAYGGLALLYTNGATIFSGIPDKFLVLGQGTLGPIPISVILMVFIVFLSWLLLEQTTLGRRLYAIGGNSEASFLSGINVRRLRVIAFTLSGVGAAIAGILLTSRLASAHPQAGTPLMLNAAAAVFLGMTIFREGEPHVLGTLFGVLIMGILGNGLNILGVNSYIQAVLTGIIIVLAVLMSGLAKQKRG
jgi:ribose transport system permease protein